MTAGINQVKSNFAKEPKMEAREATKINCPEKRAEKSGKDNKSGLPAAKS